MAQSPLYGSQARRSEYRDRLAAQLIGQGSDSSPVQHWSQGAARLAQALAGGLIGQKQDQRADERQKAYTTTMQGAMSATDPQAMIAALSGNQDTAPQALAMRQQLIAQQQAEQARRNDPMYGRANVRGVGLVDMRGAQPNVVVPEQRAPQAEPQGVAEYNFAKSQGFSGSYLDYQRELANAKRPPEAPAPTGPAPAFAGNAMDAQYANILTAPNADPTSRAYQWAYEKATQPVEKFDPTTNTYVRVMPQIPRNIAPPVYQNAAPATVPQGVTPDAGMGPGGQPMSAAPPPQPPQAQAPQAAAPQQITPTMSVQQVGAPRISGPDRQKLETATTDAAVLLNALNGYAEAFGNADLGERGKSIMGINTPVNTAYSNAALMAKGEALYQLGVLNGPDLDIIRRTLPDPSTFKGQAAGVEGAKAAVGQITKLIQDRITSHYQQKGLEPPNMGEYAAGLRGKPGGDIRSKYGLE
jgi:hypothetical protein